MVLPTIITLLLMVLQKMVGVVNVVEPNILEKKMVDPVSVLLKIPS